LRADRQRRENGLLEVTRSQKILTVFALALFTISVLVAPWRGTRGGTTIDCDSPIFLLPPNNPLIPAVYGDPDSNRWAFKLQWPMLLCEWITLGVIYTGVFHLLKGKRISN
jgi:hypothetical protein